MRERLRGIGALRVAVIIALVLAAPLAIPIVALGSGAYKNYYIPAESMMPTFRVDDRFVARMGRPKALRRGDIVIVVSPSGADYIQRVAAIAGDRIELVGGIVHLNGRAVPQRRIGSERIGDPPEAATRLSEQFPGEAQPHQIYDSGFSPFDDYGPVTLGPGQIFLLGDNRDRSADSRVSAEDYGMGGPRGIAYVRGMPWRYTWSEGRPVGGRIQH